ncbi:monosaccharide ABC transporter substrate-binding protein (CUT2 family) [Motilibacter rhizosphaerae]|uniref:Monosaccharide ABC transporter substrate-binding protein (CUT2 family) n=1 Tax=Motilibacter rhizosphaerae TaxID=598652 RepID=A0A4Q7NRI4_9ACTN|nr:substrate-binding domain-containing protein [Motilibacter rhizosphaerae]RZS89524.1 monosaccharide ABC transporter substrate-binding protein (CUT2 family) [Motilibacter rhizosphaerae]
MRKTVLRAAVFSVAGAMALSACGSSSKSDSGSGSTTGSSTAASAPAPADSTASSAGSSTAASTGSGSGGGGGAKVGVILPDTQSSARWESFDRPLLQKALSDAGLQADIQNAQGDTSKQETIAQGMIQSGAKVLVLAAINFTVGAQIESEAKQAGVAVIDYDRLNLGGSADYYVSFDNVKVGEQQGQALVDCLGSKANARIIELNGDPGDYNATLFKQGYDSVLKAKYSSGWTKVGDQSVPKWDNAVGGTTFENLLTKAGNKVDGVVAANDGLGNAVVTVLKKAGLTGVPVTGQDATTQGLQNVLAGDQCVTVYKPVQQEAAAAAKLAIALAKGQDPGVTTTLNDPQGKRDVKFVALTSFPVTLKSNLTKPFDDGSVKAADVCTGKYAALCTKYGIK